MAIPITFTDTSRSIPEEYYPYPASKSLPKWYKDLEPWINNVDGLQSYSPDRTGQTGKRCLPMFDAITSGYIMPTAFDLYVGRDKDGQRRYSWPNSDRLTTQSIGLEFHPNEQMSTFENAKSYDAIPKILSPWAIKTPKGYSVLVIPPTNRDDLKIEIFSGVMDTDKFNSSGSFPFLFKDPSFVGIIPAGTPFAQVIPFKREDYQMRIGNEKELQTITNSDGIVGRSFRDAYRRFMHTRKSYK
jgi:hypothetical protein